jgi:hypothetical protein
MDISQTPARLRTPNESAFTPIGIMGEIRNGTAPQASVPNTNLEAALERLRQGVFGKAEDGSGEGGAR